MPVQKITPSTPTSAFPSVTDKYSQQNTSKSTCGYPHTVTTCSSTASHENKNDDNGDNNSKGEKLFLTKQTYNSEVVDRPTCTYYTCDSKIYDRD